MKERRREKMKGKMKEKINGLVVVGSLGKVYTTLHCTHHVLTPILKHLSVLCPFLPGSVVGEMPSERFLLKCGHS